jgi:hypothetical protein
MDKQYMADALSLILAVGAASPALAGDPQGIESINATFPAVKLACLPFKLPVDTGEAKATIEKEQIKWYATARTGGLRKSGYPFVDAKISPLPKETAASAVPIDARMCAVVEMSVTSVPNMDIDNVAKVNGFAGYCIVPKVEACLVKAFKDSGFTQENPWPRLPIYARWPNEDPDPTDVAKVIAFLSTATKEIPPEMPGQGDTYERSTNGLQSLVPCAASGCPQQTVSPPEESKRIGWFIPAPAHQPLPANSPKAK